MGKKFDVKKKILEKSTDLFYKYGFVKASIRDIVKAVDISNSTIYLYFKNKDEILFDIILDISSALIKELQAVIEKHKDPIECLREMIFRQICFSAEANNWQREKIYFEEQYQLPPPLKKKAHEQHRQIYDLYYEKICEIAEDGWLNKNADKTVTTFSVFALMNWVYRWFDPKGRLSIEKVAENAIEVFFRGILKGSEERNSFTKSPTIRER